MKGHYLDDKATGLSALQARLEATDLIPSQKLLLDGIKDQIAALQKVGIATVADLRIALKSKKSLAALSKTTGIDPNYLQLLRRTLNGFFPKPRALHAFDWLDGSLIERLKGAGIKNTRQLFDTASEDLSALAKEVEVDREKLKELSECSDLCRIQWVSPTFARALVAAGVSSAAEVAKADPEALFDAIAKANQGAKFYKGKVGLRDVRRLVHAAAYVP